ncbi:DNA-directed DNA polymerase [Anopheles sinensis]|uniref:DNA-directed DNA polymerase n=1 Tax=Anopheles sinensis TaxID=74873 RepID=A0A084W205_ANOSI|nr:DNA-directed DNA polymerase [Anopheles sinensis]
MQKRSVGKQTLVIITDCAVDLQAPSATEAKKVRDPRDRKIVITSIRRGDGLNDDLHFVMRHEDARKGEGNSDPREAYGDES